jgi:hypothetical protein
MRAGALLLLAALAGCAGVEGLTGGDTSVAPSAGALAQKLAAEDGPAPAYGSRMHLPWRQGGTTYDYAVAVVREESRDIAVGLRYGTFPDAATAAKVAEGACRFVGRKPAAVDDVLSPDGTEWVFAGGCA